MLTCAVYCLTYCIMMTATGLLMEGLAYPSMERVFMSLFRAVSHEPHWSQSLVVSWTCRASAAFSELLAKEQSRGTANTRQICIKSRVPITVLALEGPNPS